MSTTSLPRATRGERVRSAAATVGAAVLLALGATLVVGIVLFVWGLVVRDPAVQSLQLAASDGAFGRQYQDYWESVARTGPGWVGPVSITVILLAVWLGSCRFGRGTPGDAVMSLTAQTTDGDTLPRWRTMLRTGLPLALFGIAVLLGSVWLGILVVAALWSPALVRSDRRTAFDLVAGVRVGTNDPVKGDFEFRAGSRTRDASSTASG
jgi:hypothetical protein